MSRKLLFPGLVLLLIAAFAVPAVAGDGSDTIGSCKLLPQLRYSYSNPLWDNYEYYQMYVKMGDLDNDFDTTKRMHLYYAQLNFGITDYVDIYTLVGTASMRSEYWAEDPTAWGTTFEYGWVNNNPHGFLWGVGLKGTFLRFDNGLYLGTGVSFNEVRVYDVNYKEYSDGVQSHDSINSAEKAGWHEYNLYADLHAGWHIKKIGLTPYVGVQYRWGWADMQFYGPGANVWKEYYQPENPWGMYVGADYYLNDKLYVNVQGNLINQWGVDVGIGYLFDICGKPKPVAAPPAAPAPVIEPKLEPMSYK